MTVTQAKMIVHTYLVDNGIAFSVLKGKTWDFTDLDRAKNINIDVHGLGQWTDTLRFKWDLLRKRAHAEGFTVAGYLN